MTLYLPTSVNRASLKTWYIKVCFASNNSFSCWEGPGVNVGSRISVTSWDLAVMKISSWKLSKWHSFLRIDYAEAPFLIRFLNEASLQFMGDLIDAEDEGDVKLDIGVPGVVWGP